jgi:WD40 repeat protein
VCYIPYKDLYAYSASDYSIVICKEIFVPGMGATFALYRRIVHAFLHIKLCWCEYSKVLCSVALDDVIYGWSVDAPDPLFDMSRHTNTITDIVSLDAQGLVVTCSLDKKIIFWSQRTQRVKAVLRGHTRGVRIMSALGDCLLSAGFECDAKTWDLTSLEPALTLRGHRTPIAAAKMMTAIPDCHRAITVDESGEFRLWDVLVKTGFDTGQFATTIHVFSVQCDDSLSRIVYLALPFESDHSIGHYSNVIACSSSLVHFRTEAKVTEFVAPSGMCYSEANGCIITSIGEPYLTHITGGFFLSCIYSFVL